MWEIIFEAEPRKRMGYFLDKHQDRITELEKILDDLQSYPKVKWLRLYGNRESVLFATDSDQQIRLCGRASFSKKTLTITHFSFHV